MKIGEFFWGKKHGKLAHGKNLAPKTFLNDDMKIVLSSLWVLILLRGLS
jgi:hypothetical protein